MYGALYAEGYADGTASADMCKKYLCKIENRDEIAKLAGRCLESEKLIVGVAQSQNANYKIGFFDGWLDRANQIYEGLE